MEFYGLKSYYAFVSSLQSHKNLYISYYHNNFISNEKMEGEKDEVT